MKVRVTWMRRLRFSYSHRQSLLLAWVVGVPSSHRNEVTHHYSRDIIQLAAIQLIEQGKLALDDPDIISRYLPELNDLKILKGYKDADKPKEQQTKGQEIWEDPKGRITLRMLMTHTAGEASPRI
jgi:hypothetical protein